jgi:hypothetical protein
LNIPLIGFFNDGELCWLVNFEAGIIIQLPTAVFLLYPSALITHFNVDKNRMCFLLHQDKWADKVRLSEFYSNEHPLKFVTTKNRDVPTPLNSEPLCTIKSGRGCLVFFNPASFFYPLTTGYVTLDEAEAAGVARGLDFQEHAKTLFNQVSQQLGHTTSIDST